MQQESDPTAIILSIIALGISFVALGFSGWQAITAHLARTTPLRASFALIHPKRFHDPVQLHNTGGSTASNVEIVLRNTLAKPEFRQSSVRVDGVIGAGQSVPIDSTRDRNPFVVGLWVSDPEKSDRYKSAPEGTPGAIHGTDKWAKVTWTDWRGKRRKGRIRLW